MAKNIPTVAWCALSPLYSWRTLRALPQKDVLININNEEMSKIYNLPVSYNVFCDVAWQIPRYLYDNSIPYKAWKQLKSTGTATVLKNVNDYHEEYHAEENVPFVIHQRGSLHHAYRSDKVSTGFYTAADVYLASEKVRDPRWMYMQTEEKQQKLKASITSAKELSASLVSTPVQSVDNTRPCGLIDGWLKAALDGANIWSRYKTPVPKTIDVSFTPGIHSRSVRLEGTVSDLHIMLPGTTSQPHSVIVRNMTMGPVTVRTDPSDHVVVVPKDQCWLVLVDIDGVIHVT